MVKEKYKQLCLSHQFGSIRTLNILKRWQQGKKILQQIICY